MEKVKRWSEIGEVGFLSGMRLLFWIYRTGGSVAFKIVLQPVLLYYFCSNRLARKSSLEYLQRLNNWSQEAELPKATLINVYRHFNSFARSSLDRLGAWSNGKVLKRVTFESHSLLLSQLDTGKGAVLLGAHLGNMEICRSLSTSNPRLKLNILVHTRHADRFNRLLREVVHENAITLIEVTEMTPATAIRLQDCISRGEFVAILADRVPVGSRERSTAIPFLGESAHFPDGPFILAALLKCPVYTLFCTRAEKGYVIRCSKLADQMKLPRGQRKQALVGYIQQYVQELERNVRRYPLQWFNFYPFWDQT